MGTFTRTYERRTRPLRPTFVLSPLATLLPLGLLICLITFASHLLPLAKEGLLIASLTFEAPQMTRFVDSHNPSPTQLDLSYFSEGVRAWGDKIQRWSDQYQLPPTLVATVMQIESCGAPNVTSSAGAIGLFQVMPFHFDSADDPYDPETNAARGLTYLARSYEIAERDIGKTLAGYNGGHSVIDWPRERWPEETLRYVNWGTGIWADLQHEVDEDTMLAQWLAAGGEYLCSKATAYSSVGETKPLPGS